MARTAEKTDYQLEVRKTLSATPEEVFAAWTDPKSLEQWMRPGEGFSARAKLDPRVGGKYQIDMISKEKTYEHRGVYKRLERPKLLEFTWISEGTNQKESVVTVELFDRGGKTELVLTHRLLPSDEAAKQHKGGWTEIVENLARTLSTARRR